MGFIPKKNESGSGVSNDGFAELRTKIEETSRDLIRVEINKRSGRKGWTKTGVGVDVLQPKEDDGKELDAAACAESLVTMALEDAETSGKEALYQFVGYTRSRGRAGEAATWRVLMKLGPEGDESDDAGAVVDVVKLIGVSKQMLSDVHARNLELLDKAIGLAHTVTSIATQTAEAAGKNNATLIEALKIQIEFEERKQEREADLFYAERNGNLLGRAMDSLGKPFADRFADVFGNAAESYFGMSRGDLAPRLARLLGSLTPEQRTELERIVGDDAWDVLNAAAKAKDDETFRAIFQRLVDLWSRDRTKANAQLAQIAQLLGPKVTGFFSLLRDIGIEDG